MAEDLGLDLRENSATWQPCDLFHIISSRLPVSDHQSVELLGLPCPHTEMLQGGKGTLGAMERLSPSGLGLSLL